MNDFIALLFTVMSILAVLVFALMFLLVYICTKHRREREEATCENCSKRETCEIYKETTGIFEAYEGKMKLHSCSDWKKGKKHENNKSNQRE